MAEQSGRGSLRLRLALAFVAVALTAVVALAVVVILQSRSETRRASDADRRQAAGQVAAVARARVYESAARGAGRASRRRPRSPPASDAVLILRDDQGELVLGPSAGQGPGPGPRGRPRPAAAVTAAVTEARRRVGTAELRFPGPSRATEQQLRSALWRARCSGRRSRSRSRCSSRDSSRSGSAAPLRRLTSAARRLRAGDLGARAEQPDMPASSATRRTPSTGWPTRWSARPMPARPDRRRPLPRAAHADDDPARQPRGADRRDRTADDRPARPRCTKRSCASTASSSNSTCSGVPARQSSRSTAHPSTSPS